MTNNWYIVEFNFKKKNFTSKQTLVNSINNKLRDIKAKLNRYGYKFQEKEITRGFIFSYNLGVLFSTNKTINLTTVRKNISPYVEPYDTYEMRERGRYIRIRNMNLATSLYCMNSSIRNSNTNITTFRR